jgi:hypothetical protein
MIAGKVFDFEPSDTDRHGRSVKLVTINDQSLNEDLIKLTLAQMVNLSVVISVFSI